MSKQSSVEWLIQQLFENGLDTTRFIPQIQQAKAMHEQENLETWLHCLTENDPITFEEYYKETFGGTP